MDKLETQQCEHKWIHLRGDGTVETGYRQWSNVDIFFCEKCLEQRRIETKIEPKRSYGGY